MQKDGAIAKHRLFSFIV